ncbi:MAG TPA: acyl-CoA dehydrogenase family protein [Solirubrobacter sp.]|nr:acyl-CoA dehydrogenase family protein [Solirubrobacter sp.]
MNFDLTDDQREIQRTARAYLGERYTPEMVRAIAFGGRPDPYWSEIAELGWPDVADLGTVELAVVAEELGYALAPSPLASHWAARLLYPGLQGRGTLAVDGGPAPHADGADVVVLARDEGVFAVADPEIEPLRALDATRPLFAVRANGGVRVEVPPLAWEGVAVAAAAEAVGVAARVTGMAVEYAKERRQFGRPIGSYQAVSHACAQMYLETEGARSLTYWAAWALDHDPEQAPLAAACAKAYASDAAVHVCRSALQVHGGIGFTWEHDLHLFLKRAESSARAFAAPREQRERVAELLLRAT